MAAIHNVRLFCHKFRQMCAFRSLQSLFTLFMFTQIQEYNLTRFLKKIIFSFLLDHSRICPPLCGWNEFHVDGNLAYIDFHHPWKESKDLESCCHNIAFRMTFSILTQNYYNSSQNYIFVNIFWDIEERLRKMFQNENFRLDAYGKCNLIS